MTALTTIGYLDNQVKKTEELTSLVSKDEDTIAQLTGLFNLAGTTSMESFGKNFSQFQFAVESIGRQSRLGTLGFAFESETERVGFLQRIWSMIKRFFAMIAAQVKKVWEWVKAIYAKSEMRRKSLENSLKELIKNVEKYRAKVRTAQAQEVILAEEQIRYFVLNRSVPQDMAASVRALADVMRQFRTSKGLASAIAVINSLDDQSLRRVFGSTPEQVDVTSFFTRTSASNLNQVFGTNWMKFMDAPTESKLDYGDGEYAVGALIGDKVVTYRSIELLQNKDDAYDKFEMGYFLRDQAGDDLKVSATNRSVAFKGPDDLIEIAKANLTLLTECGNTATSIKEIEAVVKRVFTLKDIIDAYDPSQFQEGYARQMVQYLRAINGLVRTITTFQPSLFAHAVKTVSAQTSLLGYAYKKLASPV